MFYFSQRSHNSVLQDHSMGQMGSIIKLKEDVTEWITLGFAMYSLEDNLPFGEWIAS